MAKEQAGPFEKLLVDAYRAGKLGRNTIASSEWLRAQAKKLGTVSRTRLLTGDRNSKTITGSMFFMNYDPKHKKTLPYYDRYPLFFVVQPAPGGFFGINLHYIPVTSRAKLLDSLYSTLSNKQFKENTRLKISYSILNSASKMALFKPCFKRYLFSHIKAGPSFIHPDEWNYVICLPLGKFEKASQGKVYADSRKILAGL